MFEGIFRRKEEKKFDAATLITDFVLHATGSANELCLQIPIEKIEEFQTTYRNMRGGLDAEAQSAKQVFRLNQMDGLIERGLEEAVYRAKHIPVIKRSA